MKIKNSYGSVITKKSENITKYVVQFFNPLLNKADINKTFESEEEALLFLRDCNFEFFDKHPKLLPRGISLNRRDKVFSFCITVRGKSVRLSSSKDLDEVCEDKFNLIKTFLS